jgi:glycosyltransferase involved in cell wall biosynthesis
LKISIIIPCFNQAQYLDEAISSLMLQTYSNWEAIIVNDGSTDNTMEKAEYWCRNDDRIKIFSTSNKGLSSARNTGIELTSGEYISLLDSDDKYQLNHLESLFSVFSRGSDIVFTGYTYFDNTNNVHHSVQLDESTKFEEILHGNIVPPVAVAFRRSILKISGLFDTSLKSAEDWDLWIRCFKTECQLGISKVPSVLYRISNNSMSRQFLTMYESLKNVSLQAYTRDPRISLDYPLNKNIEHKFNSIKKHLLLCLGVAIVQDKKSFAINILRQEMEVFQLKFKSNDFKYFCSYLSFRYYVSKNDLNWVFETLYPQYFDFFQELRLPGLNIKHSMKEVFSIHTKIRNKQKWGLFSFLVNRIS